MADPTRPPRLLFNMGVLGASQIATQLLNLASLVLAARILGVAGFGLIQVGVVVSAYALLLAEMGLMSLGIRDVARLPDETRIRAYVRVHLGLLAVLSFGVFALALSVLPHAPFFANAPAVFLLYAAFVFPQVYMLDWVSTGIQNMKWTGFFWVSRSLLYAACVITLLPHADGWFGLPQLTWVPLFYLLAFVVADLLLLARVRGLLGGGSLRPQFGPRPQWRARLAEAGPIGMSMVVMRILMNVDILLLGLFETPESVGLYAAASKIVIVLIVASNVAWKVLLPRLSQVWTQSRAEFRRQLTRFAALAFVSLLPVAVGGLRLGARFIDAVYDERFRAAGAVFELLAVAYPVLALGIFFGNGLIASNRQRAYFPCVLAAAVTTVLLNLLLIPRHGPLGAAWAAVAAATLLAASTGWQLRRDLERGLVRSVGVAMLGGLFMAVVLRFTGELPLPLLIVEGAVCYGAITLPLLGKHLVHPS